MKNIKFLCLLSLILIIIACGNKNKNEMQEAPEARETNFDEKSRVYEKEIQGIWKRQSYPYGTIEFKGRQVKFNPGEGNARLPKFKNFEIGSECSVSKSSLDSSYYDFYIITEGSNCNAIKLMSNSFQIYFAGSKQSVLYRKINSEKPDIPLAEDNSSGRILPLEPGFYVLEDTDCENPANFAWRYWNGIGLSGSATTSCEMKLTNREGRKFNVVQTCTNTYDKSESTNKFSIEVWDVNTFSLIVNGNSQKFEFCESIPSWLKI